MTLRRQSASNPTALLFINIFVFVLLYANNTVGMRGSSEQKEQVPQRKVYTAKEWEKLGRPVAVTKPGYTVQLTYCYWQVGDDESSQVPLRALEFDFQGGKSHSYSVKVQVPVGDNNTTRNNNNNNNNKGMATREEVVLLLENEALKNYYDFPSYVSPNALVTVEMQEKEESTTSSYIATMRELFGDPPVVCVSVGEESSPPPTTAATTPEAEDEEEGEEVDGLTELTYDAVDEKKQMAKSTSEAAHAGPTGENDDVAAAVDIVVDKASSPSSDDVGAVISDSEEPTLGSEVTSVPSSGRKRAGLHDSGAGALVKAVKNSALQSSPRSPTTARVPAPGKADNRSSAAIAAAKPSASKSGSGKQAASQTGGQSTARQSTAASNSGGGDGPAYRTRSRTKDRSTTEEETIVSVDLSRPATRPAAGGSSRTGRPSRSRPTRAHPPKAPTPPPPFDGDSGGGVPSSVVGGETEVVPRSRIPTLHEQRMWAAADVRAGYQPAAFNRSYGSPAPTFATNASSHAQWQQQQQQQAYMRQVRIPHHILPQRLQFAAQSAAPTPRHGSIGGGRGASPLHVPPYFPSGGGGGQPYLRPMGGVPPSPHSPQPQQGRRASGLSAGGSLPPALVCQMPHPNFALPGRPPNTAGDQAQFVAQYNSQLRASIQRSLLMGRFIVDEEERNHFLIETFKSYEEGLTQFQEEYRQRFHIPQPPPAPRTRVAEGISRRAPPSSSSRRPPPSGDRSPAAPLAITVPGPVEVEKRKRWEAWQRLLQIYMNVSAEEMSSEAGAEPIAQDNTSQQRRQKQKAAVSPNEEENRRIETEVQRLLISVPFSLAGADPKSHIYNWLNTVPLTESIAEGSISGGSSNAASYEDGKSEVSRATPQVSARPRR